MPQSPAQSWVLGSRLNAEGTETDKEGHDGSLSAQASGTEQTDPQRALTLLSLTGFQDLDQMCLAAEPRWPTGSAAPGNT